MTEQMRKEALARAEEILATMSAEELKKLAGNPEMAFHAMCATLATTAS